MNKETLKNPHCTKCQYRNREARIYGLCNYLSVSQEYFPERAVHRRMCSIAECTHWHDPPIEKLYKSGQLSREQMTEIRRRLAEERKRIEQERADERKKELQDMEALFSQRYKEGKFDSQIAREAGCHRSSVERWRNKNHLPTNFRKAGADGKQG